MCILTMKSKLLSYLSWQQGNINRESEEYLIYSNYIVSMPRDHLQDYLNVLPFS